MPDLLAITPGDHGLARDLAPWLIHMGRAGLPGVLLREPHLSLDTVQHLVEQIRPFIPAIMVHDRIIGSRSWVESAQLGLHLSGSCEVADVRAAVSGTVGQSCHHEDEVDRALAQGADYVLFSPVWLPTSKPEDRRQTLGRHRFLQAAQDRPVLALGGVTPARFGKLVEADAGAAVCGALFSASSPAEAASRVEAFLQYRNSSAS